MRVTSSGRSAPTERYPTLSAKAARSAAEALAGSAAGAAVSGGGAVTAAARHASLCAAPLLSGSCVAGRATLYENISVSWAGHSSLSAQLINLYNSDLMSLAVYLSDNRCLA